MRKVIYIDQPSQEEKKPVEFTHYLSLTEGLRKSYRTPKEFEKVVYLGEEGGNGDMFACYTGNEIAIYKGHLNSGEF